MFKYDARSSFNMSINDFEKNVRLASIDMDVPNYSLTGLEENGEIYHHFLWTIKDKCTNGILYDNITDLRDSFTIIFSLSCDDFNIDNLFLKSIKNSNDNDSLAFEFVEKDRIISWRNYVCDRTLQN